MSGPWKAIFTVVAACAAGAIDAADAAASAPTIASARTLFFFMCSLPVFLSRDRETERVMLGMRSEQGEMDPLAP